MAYAKILDKKDRYTHKGSYKDSQARDDLYRYFMDYNCPNDSQKIVHNLFGGTGVNIYDPVTSMEEVALYFHKDRGIRLKHIIIAFSVEDAVPFSIAYEEALNISQQIGRVFQNFFVIHEDKKDAPHIHMMMNTVSHINGYKYNPGKDAQGIKDIICDAMIRLEIDNFRITGR